MNISRNDFITLCEQYVIDVTKLVTSSWLFDPSSFDISYRLITTRLQEYIERIYAFESLVALSGNSNLIDFQIYIKQITSIVEESIISLRSQQLSNLLTQ